MLLSDFLHRSARRFPDKDVLVCAERRLSYRGLEQAADRLGNSLRGIGVQKQDRVAVFLENSPESVMAIFGILAVGAVFVVINPQVRPRKLAYILSDCQVRVLVTDARHAAEAAEALAELPSLSSLIITDPEKSPQLRGVQVPRMFSFEEMISGGGDSRPDPGIIDIDLASLIYTSGSTGNPKGVMLTHLNMVAAAHSITEYLRNTSDDVILSCLPLAFDYGLYQVLMAVKFGGTVILEKSFTYPYRIIDLLTQAKATGFPLVPTMAAILLQMKNIESRDLSRLRYITNTAQALAPRHIAQMRRLFPHVAIYSMYGLTECKRVSYLPPEEIDRRPASVGKAMPNTETCLVDENGQKITRPGEIGELVVRGANVMKGYWNLPEETDRRLKPGPYPGEKVLFTGDYFKTDEEGYLYFIARKDDLIKTAGERVSPKEIENVLYEMEDIVEAAVVGIPDNVLGQAVKAAVVLKEGSPLTESDIRTHCARHLEKFMVPKIIELHAMLPKTLTGKIKKTELVNAVAGA